jgi:hypothetical protein
MEKYPKFSNFSKIPNFQKCPKTPKFKNIFAASIEALQPS